LPGTTQHLMKAMSHLHCFETRVAPLCEEGENIHSPDPSATLHFEAATQKDTPKTPASRQGAPVPLVSVEDSTPSPEPMRLAALKKGHRRSGSWGGTSSLQNGDNIGADHGGSTHDIRGVVKDHHRFSQTNKGSLSAVFKGSMLSLYSGSSMTNLRGDVERSMSSNSAAVSADTVACKEVLSVRAGITDTKQAASEIRAEGDTETAAGDDRPVDCLNRLKWVHLVVGLAQQFLCHL